MYGVFTKCGFSDVTSKVNLSTGSGIQYGDVLLNTSQHTVMSIGNGQIVTASKNKNNGYTGGKPGDQKGKEIRIRSYYNHPWNYVLRYTAEDGGDVIINPPSKNEYEIKRYTEHGTAYPRTTLNIRSTPNASEGSSNVVGKYYNGEHVVYDLVVITNKYVYVSWIGASGNRRYMAVKDQDTGNRYADFFDI